MTDTPSIAEPDFPYPPRYWWAKRTALVCVSILVLLVIARLAWEWDANRRLRREIDAYRVRGEPTLPKDFATAPIPDSENYVVAIRSAVAALNSALDPPSSSTLEFQNYLPFPPQWTTLAQQAIAGQPAVFAAVEAARSKEKSDWQLVPSQVQLRQQLDSVVKLRQLANLLTDSAMYAHLNGDDVQAITGMLDTLQLARSLESQPTLIAFMVGQGIEALVDDRFQVIAPGMRLDRAAPARSAAERMLSILLDQPGNRTARALWSERAYSIDMTDRLTSDSFLLNPMHTLDTLRYLRIVDEVIRSIDDPLRRKRAKPGTSIFNAFDHENFSHMVSDSGDGLFRMLEMADKVQFDRDVAATNLAQQLYRADNNGEWPPTLEALVPRYLPRVPVDSLSPQRTPMIYLRGADGNRPMIYSASLDGIDQRAKFAIPPTPQYGWQQISPEIDDQLRDLSRFAPPPPATAEAPKASQDSQEP